MKRSISPLVAASRSLLATSFGATLVVALAVSRAVAAQQPALTGTALVANQQGASATIVDVASQRATTIEVGTGPHEAAISPDGRMGVVTIYGDRTPGNRLAIIDLSTKTLTRHIDLGTFQRPHAATFLGGSNALVAVTSEATQRVVLVDVAAGRVVADIPTESPLSHMVAVTADGKRAFTANIRDGSVSELDLERRAFVRRLAVATQTEGIAVHPAGTEVWVGSNDAGTVSVVDTKTWSVVATIPGFDMPYRLAFSPDGRRVVVVDARGDRIHIVDAHTRAIVGDVASLGSPRGVLVAPDNRTAFVTVAEGQAVLAVDLDDRAVRLRVPVGAAPDGVGYNPVSPPAAGR